MTRLYATGTSCDPRAVRDALDRWHSHEPISLLICDDDALGDAAWSWAQWSGRVKAQTVFAWYQMHGDDAPGIRDDEARAIGFDRVLTTSSDVRNWGDAVIRRVN
jgi:hypothetical protein